MTQLRSLFTCGNFCAQLLPLWVVAYMSMCLSSLWPFLPFMVTNISRLNSTWREYHRWSLHGHELREDDVNFWVTLNTRLHLPKWMAIYIYSGLRWMGNSSIKMIETKLRTIQHAIFVWKNHQNLLYSKVLNTIYFWRKTHPIGGEAEPHRHASKKVKNPKNHEPNHGQPPSHSLSRPNLEAHLLEYLCILLQFQPTTCRNLLQTNNTP